MKSAQSQGDVETVLREHAVGHVVSEFTVHGINALKTTDPPIARLAGRVLESVSWSGEDCVHLLFEDVSLRVKLERTGRLEWRSEAESLRRLVRPTGRLLLGDGSTVDFVEPAKTKRITFQLTERSQ